MASSSSSSSSSSTQYSCVVCPDGTCEVNCVFRSVLSSAPEVKDEKIKIARLLFGCFNKERLVECLLQVPVDQLEESFESFVAEMEQQNYDPRGLTQKLKELERERTEKEAELASLEKEASPFIEKSNVFYEEKLNIVARSKALKARLKTKKEIILLLQSLLSGFEIPLAPIVEHPQAMPPQLQPPNPNQAVDDLDLMFTDAPDLEGQNDEAGLAIPGDDLHDIIP